MPAQIAHLIFGEEALSGALRKEEEPLLNQYGNIFRFGVQGPDFFYHNRRTRPTGLKYGIAAHKEGYGRLVKNMIRQAFRQRPSGQKYPPPSITAYILGFTTHAILDRKIHPYINYHSGWVDPTDKETQKYFHCHAFLERILDVALLELRKGQNIRTFSLLPLVDCGEQLPYQIIKTLLKGLHASYPKMHFKSRDRKRIENAYRDTIFFYTITDPLKPHYRQLAYERDQRPEDNYRRLALFHPLEIPPDIDFLNLKRNEWIHPCDSNLNSKASFPDLYNEALLQAVAALRLIWDILMKNNDPEKAEIFLGNESLDSGLNSSGPCERRYCSPLPLPELIEEMYKKFKILV